MASNGIYSHFASPSPQTTESKRSRSQSPGRAFPEPGPVLRPGCISDGDAYKLRPKQGRQSPGYVQQPRSHPQPHYPQGSTPSWDPKSLLNPKASLSRAIPDPKPNTIRSIGTNGSAELGGSVAKNQQVFQFTSPDDDLIQMTGPPNGKQLPSHPNANGLGSMIDRINNVEERSSIPQPKRRKVEVSVDDSDVEEVARRGGDSARGSSGMLGAYIKEKEVSAPRQSRPTKTSQTVDLTDRDESEVVVVDDPGLQEVCFGVLDAVYVNCHRVPSPRPGTINLAGESFWPPVKTVLKRMVGDSTSTIQVYDHTREIFGNIAPNIAMGLVPLLDSAVLQLRTDSRIPSRKREPDEVLGQPISRSYKMEVVLYGRRRYAKTVGRILRERSLKLRNPAVVPRGIKIVNPHDQSSAAKPAVTDGPHQNATAPATYVPPPPTRTVEEVRSDVLNVFDTLKKSDELPEMDPDSMIQTELLPHQKQGLSFMMARENPRLQEKHKMSSLWREKRLLNNQISFYNVITGQSEPRKPADTLGGILADMMGLGKTLSVLSLVATTMKDARAWEVLEPEQPVAQERRRHNGPSKFHAPVPEPLGLTKLSRNGRATLLVCPLSTVANWEEQIKQHVKPGSMSYHIYHGQNRIKDPIVLASFDLVITTYGSVSSELTARSKRKAKPFPLEEVGWFRIVLDEAHMIREQSTLQFKAICRLQANRRWAVTGTPVQNRLDDLAALLAFLRLKPFDDRNKFNQHIVTPFKNADTEILPKLRVLVDTITLRRLKDKIHLPPRTDQVVRLKFTPEEQRLYDMFARNAKDRVQVLTGNKERILGGKTYIHILQSILRLRLICAHGRELLNDEDLKAVEGMSQESAIDLDSDDESDRPALPEEKAYAMFDLMKETNSDTCVMCQRKLGSNDTADIQSERQEDILGYMTPCFHVYCPKCVSQFRDEERRISHNSGLTGNCPICNNAVKFSCAELRHTRADVEHENNSSGSASGHNGGGGGSKKIPEGYGGPHTKTRALIEDLLNSKAESELQPDEPPIKSVVFSGWTSHLDLIQIALDAAGIAYTRLDGKMTRGARTQAMDTFRDDPSVHVILVSIMAGGLGLNLTAGSNVYVMEPQYNPAAEAQAIDRVHRLGQKRPVRTVRYIMENSFEEQMVELQDKKIKLASLSMDRTDRTMDKREAAKQRLIDLKTLFK